MFASEALTIGIAIAGSAYGSLVSALSFREGLKMLGYANEEKQNAENINDLKTAAKHTAEAMIKIGVNGISLITSLIQFGEACWKGGKLYYKNKKVTKNKNILLNEEAEEIAFGAIHGKDSSDSVVLGKFEGIQNEFGEYILDNKGNRIPADTSYNVIAKKMNAQYFELDNWNELAKLYDPDEIWKINEKFLDIQIASGRDIYLTANPEIHLLKDSFYTKELKYLQSHGFKFKKIDKELWYVIR